MYTHPIKREMTPVDNVLYFPNNIDVRMCPKNGMSTLKEAYRRSCDPRPNNISIEYRQAEVSKHASSFDKPFRKGSFRVAVRRDPIDRFKSACEYIQAQRAYFIRKGRFEDLPDLSLVMQEVIDSIESETIKNNHFYTQTHYLGHPSDYDMVVHIDELPKLLGFLEEACNIPNEYGIMDIFENKSKTKLYNDALTVEQVAQLKRLYMKDYKNGWCKQEDYTV